MSRLVLIVCLCTIAFVHGVQYDESVPDMPQPWQSEQPFVPQMQQPEGQQLDQQGYQEAYQPMPMPMPMPMMDSNLLQTSDPTVAGNVGAALAPAAGVAPPASATTPQSQSAPDPPATVRMDPQDKKLSDALMQVQTDLLAKGMQVKTEAKWIQDVEEIMNQYNKKIANVHTNIEALKVDMKDLLKKKRQIQNIQIQRELEQKLESAQSSLTELNGQLDSITKKSNEFSKDRSDIQTTITTINDQIDLLRKGSLPTFSTSALLEEKPQDPLDAMEASENARLAELRANLGFAQ